MQTKTKKTAEVIPLVFQDFLLTYSNDGTPYVLVDDIEKKMTPAQYHRFSEWFEGKTGIIDEGRYGVFKWDLEDFIRNDNNKHF